MFNRIARRVAAVALAGAAVTSVGITNAAAYTYTNTGSTGSVGGPVTDAAGSTWEPQIVVNARTIGKVPAYRASNQYVTVTSKLYAIASTPNAAGHPHWSRIDSSQRAGWIRGSQTAINDGGNTFDSTDIVYGVGLKVTVTVKWQLAGGRVIGTKVLNYNQRGDYRILNSLWVSGTTSWGGGSYIAYTD